MGLPKWVQRQIVDRIKLSGYRRLSYHNHSVSGDSQAFDLGNYGGQGEKHFTDFGNVRVTGQKVFGSVNFDFVFQDSRFQDPQGQRFSINYATGPWRADLGDIRGSVLNTNRFATFTKTLRGASLEYSGGPLSVKTVFSDVRGAPRTVTFNGTNTAGPYYLQSAQIVRGSETIEIDGVRQVLGQDYTINYEIGSVTFVNRATLEAKIVPPTSTIVATYEVFGFSGSRGRVQAAGLSYKFGGYGTLGLTAMQQLVGGSGNLSTRLEKFQGFGPPSTPYFLQFTPLASQPIVIRVNGILQVEGVDYFFDPDNPSIFFFNRFMPATDNIDVLYTPKPTSTVQGDRQTLGWDYRLPLGKSGRGGMLSYSEATGRLMNTPTPSSGIARGVDLRYAWATSSLIASWRNVPSGYVSVESAGFNRNERALDFRYTLKSSKTLDYALGYNNSSISARTVDPGGNVLVANNRFTKLDGSIKYQPEGGQLPVSLTHTRTRSHNPQGETSVDTTEIGTSKGSKDWDARLSFDHTGARGPLSTSGSSLSVQSVTLDTLALRTNYFPSPAWTFNFSTGLSNVHTQDKSGLGRDIQASATWRQGTRFDSTLQYQDSDAGQIATLGQFSNGYGLGYGGNGFTSGIGASGLTSASKVRAITARSSYSPTQEVNLGLRAYQRETSGSFSSNTRTVGMGLDAGWNINDAISLQTSVDTSRTDFIGTPISAANTVLSAFVDGAPRGPWSWHVGYSLLFSGGGSQFNQNSTTFDGSLGFRLAERHSLSFLVYATDGSGQFAQSDVDMSLNYQYRIWRSVALQGSYRVRRVRNLDPLVSSGAYRSSGFDLELVFNFG